MPEGMVSMKSCGSGAFHLRCTAIAKTIKESDYPLMQS
jgi:hypothetical protein